MMLDKRRLSELKSQNLSWCRARDIFEVGPDGDPREQARCLEALDSYLGIFLSPQKDGKCVCCESVLVGITGTFSWGAVNGEGYCSVCRYPARAIHRVDGVLTLSQFVLQYHPDELSFSDDEGEATWRRADAQPSHGTR